MPKGQHRHPRASSLKGRLSRHAARVASKPEPKADFRDYTYHTPGSMNVRKLTR